MERPATRPEETEPLVYRLSAAPPRDVLIAAERPAPPPRRFLPIFLFAATCVSTFLVGGLAYSVSIMTILTAHEFGHFLQARRYGVPASFPYFIPMPFTPFGTMGAVIAMRAHSADRKALFDLAITGPIAGLVPSLVLSWVGLRMSTITEAGGENMLLLGEPLVFKALSYLSFGPLPEGTDISLHSVAFAGWVGIFITALNLLPIGQLDGGHILYTLLPRRAHVFSAVLFGAAAVGIIIGQYWQWILLMILLTIFGIRHPPTANEHVPLGTARVVLGWLMLLFFVVGFTPRPFIF